MSPKILVLSLPRTGTQSIADALELLSYEKIYHMREVGKNNHQDKWVTLLDKKSGPEPQPITREDFDEILGDWDGLADFPASCFPTELMAAYPDAKVVMTVRDEDSWVKSMRSTLIFMHKSIEADHTRPMAALANKYHWYCWKEDFETYGREYARCWRDEIKQAGKGREVLEYNVKQGFKPLCEFLGVEEPKGETFPNNDAFANWKWKVAGKGEGVRVHEK